VLGVAEVSEALLDEINEKEPDMNGPVKTPRKRTNELLYDKLLHGKMDHLGQAERRHIESVLRKCAHVFHDESSNDFKGPQVIQHQILVGGAKPIRKPPYRTPFALRQEMQYQVEDMLRKGVIRPSTSPWSAPALLESEKEPRWEA
jgi:hypothetical protein